MRFAVRFLTVFITLTIAGLLISEFLGVQLGSENYWNHHGLFFLIMVSFFPRLTLLFSSVPTGGLVWWLGWIFAPRFLVALLATVTYWNQNPILVVISWLVAMGGESSEKYVVVNQSRRTEATPEKSRFERAKWVDSQ